MPNYPYVYAQKMSIPTLTIATATFINSIGETLHVQTLFVDAVIASVFVIGMRDQAGRQYVSAGTQNPIPFSLLSRPDATNEWLPFRFPQEILIEANGGLFIDVQNLTAGTVTPTLVLQAYKEKA